MFGWGKSSKEKSYDELIEIMSSQLKLTCLGFDLDPEDPYLYYFINAITMGCLVKAGYRAKNLTDKDRSMHIGGIGKIILDLFETKEDKFMSLNFVNNLLGIRLKASNIGYDYSPLDEEYVSLKKQQINVKEINHSGMNFVDYLFSDRPNVSGIAIDLYDHLKSISKS